MEDLSEVQQEEATPFAISLLRAVLALLFLSAAGWWSFQPWVNFAEPQSVDAPPEEFSSSRALEHLQWIAAAPRPMGSEAHGQVREALVEALGSLGLEVEVQKATKLRAPAWGGPARAGAVENILARWPGAGEDPALLLMAHYDSVPHSPGAGDDGSGVAAILEILRALEAGEALEHDVLVLLSDGEEAGLLGARAFVDSHPWAQRVGVAINLEARGASGPALMFRTGGANHWLTGQLQEAISAPRASSLGYEVFRFLPNDTDLSIFSAAGIEGMDFAFIGDHPRYHSARDSVENLSPESLQHLGSQALELIRQLDRQDLTTLPQGQAVYFNFIGDSLVVYPASWAVPLAVALAVIWLLLTVLAVKRGLTAPSADLKAAGGVALAALAAAGASLLAWQQAAHLDSDFGGLPQALSYEAAEYQAAFLFIAASAAAFVVLPLIRGVGGVSVLLGASFLAACLALATAILAPGGSYIFLWPAAASLTWLAVVSIIGKRRPGAARGWVGWALGAAAALPILAIWVPLVDLLLGALGLTLAWAATPLVAFALGLCAPFLEPVARRGAFLVPAAFFLVAMWFLVPAIRSESFDASHPRADSLFYCLDSGRDLARWGSGDPAPSAWMEPIFGEGSGRSSLDWCVARSYRKGFLTADAPVLPLEEPQVELIHRTHQDDGTYRMGVRIRSQRPAHRLAVAIESLASVEAFSVNGERQDLGGQSVGGGGQAEWLVVFFGDCRQGMTLELELNQAQAVGFQVVDATSGLPPEGPQRPADTMPRPFRRESDSTFVKTLKYF